MFSNSKPILKFLKCFSHNQTFHDIKIVRRISPQTADNFFENLQEKSPTIIRVVSKFYKKLVHTFQKHKANTQYNVNNYSEKFNCFFYSFWVIRE